MGNNYVREPKSLGQVLYDVHRQALQDHGTGSTPWDQLDTDDRAAWQSTAERIRLVPEKIERSPQPPIF